MIQIIDDFYSSVDALLELSDNCINTGCGFGIRSDDLSVISPEIFNDFADFIFDHYKLDKSKHYLDSYLTKHKFDPEFIGRIHIDGRNPNSCGITKSDYNLVLCGMIFLTPSLDTNSGISFYEVKDNIWDEQTEFNVTLNECYTYNKEQLENYHKNFYETLSVKNIQNRFVCWEAGSKYRNIVTQKQQERIVQNFYISVV